MATRNWKNYEVYYNNNGKIVIGVLEKKQLIPGLSLYADSSDDQTTKALSAVMQYMNSLIGDGEDAMNVEIQGFGKLTFTPARKERDDEREDEALPN